MSLIKKTVAAALLCIFVLLLGSCTKPDNVPVGTWEAVVTQEENGCTVEKTIRYTFTDEISDGRRIGEKTVISGRESETFRFTYNNDCNHLTLIYEYGNPAYSEAFMFENRTDKLLLQADTRQGLQEEVTYTLVE